MSRRRLVPVDPHHQPPIRTFIAECRKAGSSGVTGLCIANKVINKKKRHRSADDKKNSGKRRPTSFSKLKETSLCDPIPELSDKMSTIVVNPEVKDPMVLAIEGMEERLKASMKENREKEIAEMESNMKEIIETSIQRAIDTMGSTIHQMISSNPVVQTTTSEICVLREENTRLKEELQYLSAEQVKLESRMERIENRNLENCVIFRGLKEDYKETDEMGRDRIYRELSNLLTDEDEEERYRMARRLVIRRYKRLGRYNRDRPRPVSVEFVHHEDVSFIMENKSYLSDGIFVNREFSLEIERKRRTMLPILRAARHIDNYMKQIRLEKDKIVIKGKDYDMSNIHDLPDDLNAFKVTSKEDGRVVGYFGELNPLSNFFPAKFTLDGHTFISSEQYIQASKADFLGDRDIYNQIMGCKHSVDCKDFSRKIKGVDNAKWDMVAADLCRPGICQKFIQNPILLEILVKRTGTMRIVECSKDRLWGTGILLTQDDCLDCDCWISPGIMGKILEDIRAEFYNQLNSDNHSLNGIQHNPPGPPESLLGQATQVAIPDSGLASHSKLSSVVQPHLASQTTNDLHPTMSQCLTTPSEVQSPKHLKAKSMVNDQLTATSMDHSWTIDGHCSEKAIAEQAGPSAN